MPVVYEVAEGEDSAHMDQNGGLLPRRLPPLRPPPINGYVADVMSGSTTWIGRGFSCVCVQRRESDTRILFDLTPVQEECLQRLQNRIEVPYDSQNREHQNGVVVVTTRGYGGNNINTGLQRRQDRHVAAGDNRSGSDDDGGIDMGDEMEAPCRWRS